MTGGTMKAFTKRDFPVSQIRRFLEPGPIVLVSSARKGETNIMTMGWHTVMEFTAVAGRLHDLRAAITASA